MNKSITKIFLAILISSSMLSSQVILPLQAEATPILNWNNPNQGGNNAYKLSVNNIVTSGMLTSLVGCTGIVKKVAKLTTDLANTVGEALGLLKKVGDPEVNVRNSRAEKAADAQKKRDEQAAFREECINGIAVRLARNQLTAMTRNTLNWINSGFNGDPMYVREINSYIESITQKILEKEVSFFKDPKNASDYPYGRSYAENQVDSYRSREDTFGALKQDLTNYLQPGSTIQDFAKDFGVGGWEAYVKLAQAPNNPLGFSMLASEYRSREEGLATLNAREEINRNGGFLDQKKCAEYAKQDPDDDPSSYQNPDGSPKCLKFETITPGSILKSKVDKAINSPETQLELVKTLNDGLNALFGALLDKFQSQGLAGLRSGAFTNVSDGFGSNALFDSNGNPISLTGGFSGGGATEGFNLTRDLGNTYIKATDDGEWNAKTNTPELALGVGTRGHFYTVSVGGTSKISSSVTYWAPGDKAFFDGKSWKRGVPNYIIDKKGALQVQNDFVEGVNEAGSTLPTILPAIGELDYCIPGPNPDWASNVLASRDAIIEAEVQIVRAHQTPDVVEKYWVEAAENLSNEFDKKMKPLYGDTSLMQTEFLENGEDNPSFLRMSSVGLNLTKNLSSYADAVGEATEEYKENINQTQTNIYKLNKIKDKVNVIIAAAQKRRDTKRAEAGLPKVTQLCIDTERVTYISNGVLK